MDIRHHFIEKGEGQPLLLLHGNGENGEYFKNQIDVFARGYHVFAIDTRGHGQTPRGKEPFTIRQFAEDLLGFMDEHEIVRADILGFSDGGNIAMVFALNHPDRVKRLILNGANLDPSGVKRRVQIPIDMGYKFSSLFAKRSEKALARSEMLGLMVNDPDVQPEELSRIQAPTLVIAGTKDLILRKHTKLIAECIPDSLLVFIQGDHCIAAKNPKAFNHAVLRFLKEHPAK
ncbi:MAG: alpha/beta hydrolase [Blautia sp.]|nr:alpha/beta hydrolase [Blautia sp.]